MSILARPTVVFAIVFCCFAVLVPRVFLPLFRSKTSTPSQNIDESKLFSNCNKLINALLDLDFRRPSPPIPRSDHADPVEHIPVCFILHLKLFFK
jgi:hypothetical protein